MKPLINLPYLRQTLLTTCLSLGLFGMLFTSAPATHASESSSPQVAYQNYTSLAELVTLICDDAISKLQGFFGPTVVEVRPFVTFGQYQENKISSLGVSLADQMMAMVNNDTVVHSVRSLEKKATLSPQKLQGTVQEMDGFLRVHIRAANVYGDRMSYTTSVEMSEPIYRALHTYL